MTRNIGAAVLAAITLISFAPDAQARDDRRPSWFGKRDSHRHDHHRDDDARRRYFASPRSTFIVTLGNGYAGRGYYYGPPNAPYYYQGTGISYYSTRERVPAQYWGGPSYSDNYRSLAANVQHALARRGYYRGRVDGSIGSGTKAAISAFQRDNRLAVTGNINNKTLNALGIR